MKLLVRPKPEKGESFTGYLVRLTELNAYDTPSWILSLSDIDYMELQWTFSFVFSQSKGQEKLAQLTNNALDDLTQLLYLPANSSQGYTTEHEYDFYGAFLNRSIIRPHGPKICPKCLSESGYCFRIWDCSLVTACPTHECMLIDSCPKCKKRIRAVRNSLSICACRCDWREIDPEFLTPRALAVSRRVYQLCGLLPNTLEMNIDSPLRYLDLQDFVVVLSFISGLFRKIAWAKGRPSKSIKLLNKDLHQLYSGAYSVFEDWPHTFHRFLQKLSKGVMRLNPDDGRFDTSLKREFGCFYEHLYHDLDGAQFDFIRDSFAEFLTNRLMSQSQEPGSECLPASFSETDERITLGQARRLLKISHRALSELIGTSELRCVIKNQGTTLKYLVRLSDVENLKCKFEQSLSTRSLARILGVECEEIRELARAGHLRARWRPAVDGYHTIKFDRDSVVELLNRGILHTNASQVPFLLP